MCTKNNLVVDIKITMEEIFALSVVECKEIERGLLNLKWKFITDKGSFFVKQYNADRYPPSKEKRLNEALSFQEKLNNSGAKCPQVFTYKGERILRTKRGIRFGVTEYCEGNLVKAGGINCNQFHDLGVELAKIHDLMNKYEDKNIIPAWVLPTKEQMMAKWKKNYSAIQDNHKNESNQLLYLQREIIEDLDMDIFAGCKQGWAHSDLWCDNVLFHPNSLSALLDFDRVQYIYPELDISRAILSFALQDNILRIDAINAFIEGYNQVGVLYVETVIRSLKLMYCLESFWWLNNASFNSEGPPKRFTEEMVWLTKNWRNLEIIFKELRNKNAS